MHNIETHFTKQSYIKLKGYKVYHTTHPENSAAVIIKENLRHSEETKFEAEDIQATVVNVKTKNYNLTVIGLYCPPKHNIKTERYSELFEFVGDGFIMGRDRDSLQLRVRNYLKW